MIKFNRADIIKYLILTGIFVLIFLLLFWPNYKTLTQISGSISSKMDNFKQLQTVSDPEKSLSDMKNLAGQLPTLDKIFLKEGDELTMVTDLEQIAAVHNVNQKISLAVDKLKIDEHLKSLPITLDVTGNYNDLILYLADIKNLNYKLIIQNITFIKTANNQIQANLIGTTYWYSP